MPVELVQLLVAFGAFALLTYVALYRPKALVQIKKRFANKASKSVVDPTSKLDGPNKGRKWGSKIHWLWYKFTDRTSAWIPEEFQQPWPEPCPDWSVVDSKPIPYRPFRYGPKYNVTMGIRSMPWEDWVELDNHWPSYHRQKQERLAERADRLVMVHAKARDAAQETLELLSKYLTKRYPSLFRYTSHKEEAIEIITTGEVYPIANSDDPLKFAALLIQDDLAIMMEGADGLYYLRAGAIVLPGFWRLEDKFGMPLEQIHTSGDGSRPYIYAAVNG
jgi:hypothetical protein